MGCNRCEGTGFLNFHQLPQSIQERYDKVGYVDIILAWIIKNDDHDVQVCDCCGNSDDSWWYGPGEHDYEVQPVFDCM